MTTAKHLENEQLKMLFRELQVAIEKDDQEIGLNALLAIASSTVMAIHSIANSLAAAHAPEKE
jgi:hypothetical protein